METIHEQFGVLPASLIGSSLTFKARPPWPIKGQTNTYWFAIARLWLTIFRLTKIAILNIFKLYWTIIICEIKVTLLKNIMSDIKIMLSEIFLFLKINHKSSTNHDLLRVRPTRLNDSHDHCITPRRRRQARPSIFTLEDLFVLLDRTVIVQISTRLFSVSHFLEFIRFFFSNINFSFRYEALEKRLIGQLY